MATPSPKRPAAKPSFGTWLALGNVALTLVLTVLVVQWRGESAEDEQARARDAVTGAARALAQSVADDLVRVDGVLRSAVAAFEREPDDRFAADGPLAGVLSDLRAGLADADVLLVSDANGDVRLGLPPGAPAANLAGRDFVAAARTVPAAALPVVSRPWVGTVSGTWGISIARPLRAADGAFLGTVHANLGSAYLARRLAGAPLGPDGIAALRTAELALIARVTTEGESTDGLGTATVSAGLKAAVAREPAGGHIVSRSPRDGVVRGVAYQRVAGFPLYVIVAQGTGDAFADAAAKQ
jgi:hypothetical protein